MDQTRRRAKRLRRSGINTVVIANAGYRAPQTMDACAFCNSVSWRPVYMDEVSVVLLGNDLANQRWIDRLAIDCQTASPPAPQSKVAWQ